MNSPIKLLAITLHVAAAVLVSLAALDQYFATMATTDTPPVVYHSPSFIPAHAIWWGIGCSAVGVLLQTILRKDRQ